MTTTTSTRSTTSLTTAKPVVAATARSAQKSANRRGRVGWWASAIVAMFIALLPFYWMFRTAVAPADQVFFEGISFFPSSLTFQNFEDAWTLANLDQAMINGAIVTFTILVIQLVTCIPAAFAFAKLRFPGRNLLFGIVLAALLIPIQATAIPTYIGLARFDVIDNRFSLVVPFMTSAFGIFVIRQYMTTIPDSLIEAARMDGLGAHTMLWRVIVPLARPAILTFAIFSVFIHWNDYLWPLLVARSPELATPPLALATFQDAEMGTNYGALAAGAVIVTLPILILFVLARKRFVAGIGGGEVTG